MISKEMSRISVTPEAVVAALVASAPTDFLSAQLWPLDLAVGELHDGAPVNGALRRAVERMPQAEVRNGVRFTALRETIRTLVRQQLLVPRGSGWEAGYAVAPGLLREGRLLAGSLDRDERRLLLKAGQALLEATKMASKKPDASVPSGLVTI